MNNQRDDFIIQNVADAVQILLALLKQQNPLHLNNASQIVQDIK